MGERANIAVVGGGVAGLAAARALIDRGRRVTVFDKGRGPGGRASTRRSDHGSFDHGAQYFTARDTNFARAVDAWRAAGVVAPWEGRFGVLRAGAFEPDDPKERLVGVPGMNDLVRAMGEGIDVRYGVRVASLSDTKEGWRLAADDGPIDHDFDGVVIAVPAPQAAELLGPCAPDLARAARTAEMAPCWTTMATFERQLGAPFEGAVVGPTPGSAPPVLGWIGCDSSKPGRDGGSGERWVLQATPEWSAVHLEDDAAKVRSLMLDALFGILGNIPMPTHAVAHRWRYASVRKGVGAPCLRDDRGIAVCGDWLLHPRIEAAWLSGVAAGGALGDDAPAARE